ncbi:MAG: hypothetical protein U9O83_06135 [Campylobacterota bacterium]|nr:hypothetical protein [Campylobacterota bacterium]
MNKFYIILSVLVVLGVSGCSSKAKPNDGSYERANKAASEAHQQLRKD